ncbi:MAG TPA: peptidase M61 [Dokdonella sp.]|uniref:M61 family metallopeptidase n=1 Tax=Dokdonella sp. TaxID=2291710 RepID=UPI0025C6EF9B|nr:peptidase M61 [Dokdonella sp.]HNR91028.1 peptidase M61 [Dokdonella sp.]
MFSTVGLTAAATPAAAIRLDVDASDTDRRIFRVREELAVEPGPLTLHYPKWLPGNHAPTGPIEQFAGLVIGAGDQRLAWRRDPLDMHAFHVVVPPGVSRLALEFQFVSPLDRSAGRVVVTPSIIGVQWNAVILYPGGVAAKDIGVEATLRLPEGWAYATALEGVRRPDGVIAFAPTSLETLVDSPLFAGRHFRRFELDASKASPIGLNAFADAAHLLEADAGIVDAHRALVVQADRLFGTRPFERYDFLLAVSDVFSGIGLEHHRSSENGTYPDYLTAPRHFSGRDLLAHEYVHAWNGKFRRPAGLATPDFHTPMRGDLLWLYEGQTEYWGIVLAARSGLWTSEQARDAIAEIAAACAHREGRAWRSLADTTSQPTIAYRQAPAWPNWQRGRDYYSEGVLVWLDVDTRLRELSRGRRSLDDFARHFFAGGDNRAQVSSYALDDIVQALERVQPGDWAAFLKARIDATGDPAPLDGLARSGWALVYRGEPGTYARDAAQTSRQADFSYSLGFSVASGGQIAEVLWDSPAFAAGLSPAMTVVAVDGEAWDNARLERAIRDAAKRKRPVELLVRDFDRYRSVRIDYHGGLRHPYLERASGRDRLGDILAPRR